MLSLSVLNTFIDLPSGNDLRGSDLSDLFAEVDLEGTLSANNNGSLIFAFFMIGDSVLSSDGLGVERYRLLVPLSVLNAFIDLPSGNNLRGSDLSDLFGGADLERAPSVDNTLSLFLDL